MGRTVFSKLMLIFIVIILLSTVLSAVLVSQSYSSTFKESEKDDMMDVARDVSTMAAYFYVDIISSDNFKHMVQQQASDNQDVIWVLDPNGIVWLQVDPTDKTQITTSEINTYFDNMLGEIRKGNGATVETTSKNFFNAPLLTVAWPVIIDGNVIGAVFVHKKLSVMTASMMDMYRQIIYVALISAAVAVILIYFLGKNILKPLREVTSATKQLARGNFDVRLNIQSEDEIGELSATFNSVAEDLGKYENTRRSFVANVSHDLRSPLTSIQGMVQGILDGTIHKDQEEQYLSVVLDETKRLNLLINDLLDLSQIESGKIAFTFKNIDINELIRRCLITFESRISAKKIDVDVDIRDDKQYVNVDENRVWQVMMNLIDNAVKFTPEGGMIRIYTKESPASIFVNVNNTGEVILAEDLPYVFERFYKADKSRTRTQEGTGLGLSIVKKILVGHGQNIWVKSNVKDGTTFTFTLKKV